MKRFLYTITLLLITANMFAQFTSNRIVVVQVGNGAAALTNAGTRVTLQEYTYSGTAGFTRILDTTGSNRFVLNGSAGSEGYITNSPDFTFLVLAGYDTTTGITSINTTSSANINRKLVGLFSSGMMFTLAKTNTHISTSNPRSGVISGNNMWMVGGNTGVIGGLGHIDTIVSSTLTNLRCINIFKNQLFVSTGSGSTRGVYRVGNATPVNSGNTLTSYVNDGATASPYQFSFNPDTNICYIADDRNISGNTAGGIQKWVRSGSVWTKVYTLGTGPSSTVGARGLAVNWNGANPVIFATTSESSANRLISITDTGALTPAIVLATAPTNTAFRGIAFTPGTNPLPVHFTAFKATQTASGNLLTWSTAMEMNNSGFEVQRSKEGQAFENIAFVKGAGNSNNTKTYTYNDTEIDASKSYCYRLKQIDFDGAFEYSKTVCAAAHKLETGTGISTQPNPFNTELTVLLNAAVEGNATVELVDMVGKVIAVKSVNSTKNNISVQFDTNHLNNGIYFVRINQSGTITTRKVVKR
jgi:hypothetical protein